jgi:DNA invertase Pin-like site-specific DNA recombinase
MYASLVDTVKHPAAIYARQSKAKDRSIAEQIDAGRRECEREGWAVSEVYKDRVSASRFARGERPDWKRLLADLEAGRFGVLVLWESSRGDRDAETWLGLLRRCRDRKVLIRIIADERTYDMARRQDWKTLADDGVSNADDSEKTKDRIMRAVSAQAHAGGPHGPAEYGYERIYDEKTRKLIRQQPDPRYAPVVRDIIGRAASNVPLKTITDDLNRRGVPAPRGGRWERSTVRKIARNPAYIGKRKWRGQLFDAIWPPLVDEATYWRSERILSEKILSEKDTETEKKRTTRPARQKWLLSYFATCGACGELMQTFTRPNKAMYGCSSGHGCAYITVATLDGIIASWTALVMGEDGDARKHLPAGSDAAIIAARAEADALQGRLDEHARESAAGKISARALAIVEAELAPQIAAAQERANRATIPAEMAAWMNVDLAEKWPLFPVPAKRALLRRLAASIAVRGRKAGPPRVIITSTWGEVYEYD